MSLIKRDIKEQIFNSLLLLQQHGNPDYWEDLFTGAKHFFIEFERLDLIEEMEELIFEEVEDLMGRDITDVLEIRKRMFLQGKLLTRSVNPKYSDIKISAGQLDSWLRVIKEWIFLQVFELSRNIRFTLPAKQWA